MAETRQENHQPPGISARAVLWAGIAIVTGILLAAAAAYLLWRRWGELPGAAGAARPPAAGQPLLQAAPQQERAQYFAEKRKLLESWEWIDRRQGIARIPVQQAMGVMAARGGNPKPAPKERK